MLGCQSITLPSAEQMVSQLSVQYISTRQLELLLLESKAQQPNIFLSMFAWDGFTKKEEVHYQRVAVPSFVLF